MTISLFLHLGNKDLKKTQLIIISTQAVNLAKRATDITGDLIMMVRKKNYNSKAKNLDQIKNTLTVIRKATLLETVQPAKKKPEDEKIEQETKRIR